MKIWTTRDLPAHQQFGYWREALCQAFTALDTVPPDGRRRPDRFDSRVEAAEFIDVGVAHLYSDAQSAFRGVREIRRQPTDFFFANLQLAGRCIVRQDGRELVATSGDLYLVDTSRPYELTQSVDGWHTVACRIPEHRLTSLRRRRRDVTAINLTRSSSLGPVLAGSVQALSVCPESIPLAAQEALVCNVASLLEVALGCPDPDRSVQAVREETRRAILRHVENCLGDADLSVETVARRFHVSARYLHKLFEGSERTFAQSVMELRLLRCQADLSSPACTRPVSDIAYRWGFGDLSHFSRMFRRRFNETANDVRARARLRS